MSRIGIVATLVTALGLSTGCSSVLNADAERTHDNLSEVVSLPGSPDGDFLQQLLQTWSTPVAEVYQLDSDSPINGTQSYYFPEALGIITAGRREGISMDFNAQERWYSDIPPAWVSFRSKSFAGSRLSSSSLKFSMRLVYSPEGNAVTPARPLSNITFSIDDREYPQFQFRVGTAVAGAHFDPHAPALAVWTVKAIDERCALLEIQLNLNGDSSKNVSVPVNETLRVEAASFGNSLVANVIHPMATELDPTSPLELWRSACTSESHGEENVISLSQRHPDRDFTLANRINGERGFMELFLRPANNSRRLFYDANRTTINADDFTFNYSPGGFFLDNIEGKINP